MSKWVRVAVGLLCLMGFVLVRFRESELFYDPLLNFYKGHYHHASLPRLEMGKYFLSLMARYGIHMILSLGILWVVFLEKGIIKFATILYLIIFIILVGILFYLLSYFEIGDANSVFYARRFLIQPLLVFILLPAFFYYRKVNT